MNDTTYFSSMMTYMDKLVGRIADKTDQLGIRENTIIIFTGDNGTDRDVISTWQGQRIQGQKGYTVEAGTHVPLIVNWKGVIAHGQVNDNLVDFTDFYPTLLDVAGVSQPETTRDGISFYSQLLGEESETRSWIFCHYAPNWGQFPSRRYVQNTELKLYDDGSIYQVKKDPMEEHPVELDHLDADQQHQISTFRGVLDRMQLAQ